MSLMLNKFVDKGLLERLNHVATSAPLVFHTEAAEILQEARLARSLSNLSRGH